MAMEATVRLIATPNRHISAALRLKTPPLTFSPKPIPPIRHSHRQIATFSSRLHFGNSSNSFSSFPSFPISKASNHQIPNSIFSSDRSASIFSDPKDNSPFNWHFASDEKGREIGGFGNEGPAVAVVLLGWLGAKHKHMRRYVELYNSKGIHAVTFVASVRDILSFDLARKLEERIAAMASELAHWVSQMEEDGRERVLIFHTFSNTGWLTYGSILNNLQSQKELLNKIRGCIVDSGGDPHIDPKVWAAGFTVALLKKRSSIVAHGEGNELDHHSSKTQEKKPSLFETLLLDGLENFFSFLLNLPNENRRLVKIISTLMNDQPPCPQLYLYSTSDKVIPYQSVELFIEEQKKRGRRVLSFNFGTSPHVDHYRTFPSAYASLLQNFLEECLVMVKKS